MKERTGNCFENCARFLIDAIDKDAVLVHAVCVGRGDIEGIEYSHAFLLVADGRIVIDRTTDKTVVVDAVQYYALGQVREVARYNRDQMMAMLRQHEHFGPWHATLEALGN